MTRAVFKRLGRPLVAAVATYSGFCVAVQRQGWLSGARTLGYHGISDRSDTPYTVASADSAHFTPDAEIIRYGEQTTRRQSARMTLIQHQSLLKYFRKHHDRAAATILQLLSIVETGLRVICWSLSSLIRRRERA